RILIRIERGRATLLTRNRQDWTHRYAPVAQAAAALAVKSAIVDGEVVAVDRRGGPSFQALQHASSLEAGRSLAYGALGLLFRAGGARRGEPLVARRALRARRLGGGGPPLGYSEHFEGPGKTVYDQACRMGLEGIVSKQKHAPFSSGRSQGWLKTKCFA